MKQELKVFFAGKVDPKSRFLSPVWRDELVWTLNEQLQRFQVKDTSFFPSRDEYILRNNLSVNTLFAQSCFYIRSSDLLVVNLSDDISVAGSQEIFIAKQFNVPIIGIAPRGGKFNRLQYELGGKLYWNWTHPFTETMCDVVVNDQEELTQAIDNFEVIPNGGLKSIGEAVNYYQRNAAALDTTVNRILSYTDARDSNKQKLRIYFAGKMSKASGFPVLAWREELANIISRDSRFKAVNLDFVEVSHSAVDENDPKLIFGRDAYLIRSSDFVVVNLSDDISIGGSIEMLLAKLYHRPLLGIAQHNGKFVSNEKDFMGRILKNYVNPFVSATCDWLIQDPLQLPTVIDQLFNGKVKTNRIVADSATWYQQSLLAGDKVAQAALAV